MSMYILFYEYQIANVFLLRNEDFEGYPCVVVPRLAV